MVAAAPAVLILMWGKTKTCFFDFTRPRSSVQRRAQRRCGRLQTLKPCRFRAGAACAAWRVTFENPDPCAMKGSSVEFRCSYNYSEGETVKAVAWYKGEMQDGRWIRVKVADFPSIHNRSVYLGDTQHNCSLAIHDLHENDTGHYYFYFETEAFGRQSKRSIRLSVAGEIPVRSPAFELLRFPNQPFCFLYRAASQGATLLHGEGGVWCDACLRAVLPNPCHLVQRWGAGHQRTVPGSDRGCWELHVCCRGTGVGPV